SVRPPSTSRRRGLGHVTEMIGHVPETVGHDAENTGHALPKYAVVHCGKRGPCGAAAPEAHGTGFVPVGSTAEEFRARIRQEIDRWTAAVKAGNIKPNA
ncbi:MAG: hypothetical protein WA159_25065, partial [Variovorax sp.]